MNAFVRVFQSLHCGMPGVAGFRPHHPHLQSYLTQMQGLGGQEVLAVWGYLQDGGWVV